MHNIFNDKACYAELQLTEIKVIHKDVNNIKFQGFLSFSANIEQKQGNTESNFVNLRGQ